MRREMVLVFEDNSFIFPEVPASHSCCPLLPHHPLLESVQNKLIKKCSIVYECSGKSSPIKQSRMPKGNKQYSFPDVSSVGPIIAFVILATK